MPIKPFKLGSLSADREWEILLEVYNKAPIRWVNLGLHYPSDIAGYIVSDLVCYGLIRHKEIDYVVHYVMTKKGINYVEKRLKEG